MFHTPLEPHPSSSIYPPLFSGHKSDHHKDPSRDRVVIWMRMDVVPVEYGTFAQTFHLKMWFFQFITGINFKWDYVIGRSVALLIWIGLWTKLRIDRVPPDPVRWSCRGFGFLWQAFMMNWMLWTKNDLKIFHRKQVNVSPEMKLVTSLMNF